MLITAKFNNDIFFANNYIASVGGVTLQNLNELEKYFIKMVDWKVYISTEEFLQYENVLLQQMQSSAQSSAVHSHPNSPLASMINSPVRGRLSPEAAIRAQNPQMAAMGVHQASLHALEMQQHAHAQAQAQAQA